MRNDPRKRDVLFNSAVTLVPRVNGRDLIGERELELGQFAVEFPARKGPYTEAQVYAAFAGMSQHVIKRMREAGLLK